MNTLGFSDNYIPFLTSLHILWGGVFLFTRTDMTNVECLYFKQFSLQPLQLYNTIITQI
jgi:hypothetical protein